MIKYWFTTRYDRPHGTRIRGPAGSPRDEDLDMSFDHNEGRGGARRPTRSVWHKDTACPRSGLKRRVAVGGESDRHAASTSASICACSVNQQR